MNQKGKQLAIWGVILQFGTVVGLVGTVVGMVRAFSRLVGLAEPGTIPVSDLSADLSIALYTTVVGSLLALVGIVFILIALLGIRYRAAWFRTALWFLSFLWLLWFPIGTILGIVIIVYLINHKNEFSEPSARGDGIPTPQP